MALTPVASRAGLVSMRIAPSLLPLALALSACACTGCSEEPVGAKPSPTTTSNPTGSSSSGSSTTGSGSTTSSSSSTSAAGGGSAWEPVPWQAPCAMEQAVSPAKAVDPLQWVDCGSIPGCRRLNITWKYDVEPLGVTKVGATDAGLRVSTVLAFLKGDDHPWPHYAIFDANGPALAVWRSSGAVTGCLSFPPAVRRNRVWYGVLDFDSGATAYIHPTYDELMVVS